MKLSFKYIRAFALTLALTGALALPLAHAARQTAPTVPAATQVQMADGQETHGHRAALPVA